MVTIIQKDNPILRQRAKEIPVSEIKSGKIKKIIADMKRALRGEEDGAAIAAPQIAKSVRIFIVAGKILKTKEADPDEPTPPDMVCINPELIRLSRKKELMHEGCLSIRGWYGTVERSTRATIRAYDENGKKFERGGSGLLAQVFQHETDHLNGILFIDRATRVWEVPVEKGKM